MFEGFEIFSNHQPFDMMVDPADIALGFDRSLQTLQGRHGTFYTGAAFQTNDSSRIWRFTESLLPQITAQGPERRETRIVAGERISSRCVFESIVRRAFIQPPADSRDRECHVS